ncbi:hypothetical protein GW17_00029896 [Ensete ventricosum]|nr:hypothetical protein GW17_00029896 [Ensete ventricosum]
MWVNLYELEPYMSISENPRATTALGQRGPRRLVGDPRAESPLGRHETAEIDRRRPILVLPPGSGRSATGQLLDRYVPGGTGLAARFSQPKTATRTSKASDEDDLWGPVAVPASRTVPHIVNVQPAAPKEDDGLWGSIAVAPPKTTSRPLKTKASAALDDSDPWAAIAAPPPTTKAKPLSLGRGRGTKPASARLGAQRIDRSSPGS